MVLINFSNAKPSGSEWAIKVDFKCHRHRTRLESRASRTDLAHNAELIMGRRGMSLLGSLGSLRNELEGMRERERKKRNFMFGVCMEQDTIQYKLHR